MTAARQQQFCAAAGVPESISHEAWTSCGGEAGAHEPPQRTPAGIVRNMRVSRVPFDRVSPEHACREGEGSRPLAEWRQVHRRAFAPDRAAGLPYDEKGLCAEEI